MLISAIGLQALRQNMREGREEQILKIAQLCLGVMDHYHQLEVNGTLTREQAQAKAIEAISGLRHGDDYVFVRSTDNRMLVHADPKRVGQIDKGSPTADGRLTSEVYVQELAKSDHVFIDSFVARPGDPSRVPVAKLLGAMRFAPWDWIVGTGVFIDDLDAAFRSYALRFLAMGGVLLAVMAVLGTLLTRSIQRQLGGDPQYAAEVVNRIAAGDLGQSVVVDGPASSLLASMQRMQEGLRGMVRRVRRLEVIEEDQPWSGGVGERQGQHQQGVRRQPVTEVRPVVSMAVEHPRVPSPSGAGAGCRRAAGTGCG